jgi:hypothetical protein
MKVGVAFDYMRVRVRDIIHLEKFNPAMRELYKQEEEEDGKAKRAAKEAFSDDEAEVGDNHKAKLAMKAEKAEVLRRNQEEKKARKMEEWERRRRERAAKTDVEKGNGEVSREREDVAMGEATGVEPEVPEEVEKKTAVQ